MRIQSVQPVKGEVLRRGRSLSGIEIRAVINNCHQRSKQKQHTVRAVRDKALFVLACTAGLRSAELRSLTVDCFDSHVGCIRVRNAKGRKQREIHLCSLARHALKPWLVLLGKSHGALFRPVSQTGNIQSQRLSATGLSSIFRQLQSDSGIEPFSPHDLRRTFITQLLQNGEDINTVRQLAGHSAITTTAGYDYRDARTVCAASRRLRFSSSPTLTI
jgi:site-specific recombinase XerD